MTRFTNTLARVRVAAPCPAEWDEMRGDERVRFCHHCSLNVYNLSAMTKREAERLVTRSEDSRLCVRFYRRADGTVLTQNCPIGLRALKRRVSRVASATFAAVISFLAGIGIAPATKKPVVAPSTTTSESVFIPAPLATEEESVAPQEREAVAGAMGLMIEPDPLGEQFAAGASLGIMLFVIGYPLLKLRDHNEAKHREELRIWRNS